MKVLEDYNVTLHNQYKRGTYVKVRACVSPTAACAVADMKYKQNNNGRIVWQATYAYVPNTYKSDKKFNK